MIELSIGIDPGKSGCISVIGTGDPQYMKLSETPHDLVRWLREEICVESGNVNCVVGPTEV